MNTSTPQADAHAPASFTQAVRSAFLMYFAVSLIAVPCADWLAGIMGTVAGAGDFRDGSIVLESVVSGSIGTLALPLGFGALVLFPAAIPLRMAWLTFLSRPAWSAKTQLMHALRRTPAAVGSFILLLFLGCCLLALLGAGVGLVYASFDGDPNRRSALLWTLLAALPLLIGATLLLAALDLTHAACVHLGPIESLQKAASQTLRSSPTYLLYALLCLGTLAAGVALDAPAWALLPALQALVFVRYIGRALWLRVALTMTTPDNHAMHAQ